MLRMAVWIILLALVLWVLSVLSVWTARAQTIGYGITCADVRKLTAVERWYWIKRLGLSQEQVNQIRKVCRK